MDRERRENWRQAEPREKARKHEVGWLEEW
jgi:hypothetical protein